MRPRTWASFSLVLPVLLTTFCPAGRGDEPKPASPDAAQILERMGKAYAECKSYRDSGVVKTVFIRPGGDFTSEKPFTTAFVRPDRFRYEFKDTKPDGRVTRFLISKQGDDVRSWWDVTPRVEKHKSLAIPVAMATGISGSSAHTVPTMLLYDEIGGGRFRDLTEAKRIDDDKLGDVDCYRVEGKFGNQPSTVWIDKDAFLIRRIDQKVTFPDFRTEQTTTYDPAVGVKVEDEQLKFDPPGAE